MPLMIGRFSKVFTALLPAILFTAHNSVTHAAEEIGRAAAKVKECSALFQPASASAKIIPFKLLDLNGNPYDFTAANGGPPVVMTKLYDLAKVHSILAQGAGDKRVEAVKYAYEKMIERGEMRAMIMPTTLAALDGLYLTMPNFKPALDIIKKSLAVSIASSEPIRIPPMLLLGDPGLGKTHFAEEVSKILGTSFEYLSMADVTDGWVLTGNHPTWNGASMGELGRLLIEGWVANPFVLVDEIDKAGHGPSGKSPLAPFYGLLETRTARNFQNEFLAMPMDASHINWIATANGLEGIPNPILKRFVIVKISAPTKEEMGIIVPEIMRTELSRAPKLKFSNVISESVFALVYKFPPRTVRKIFADAIGNAVLDGRSILESKDIDLKSIESDANERRGIGFVQDDK